MTKIEADIYIRKAGVFSLLAVIFTLISAAILRLPGTEIGVFNAITPMIGVELIHNKAELMAILGPAGSVNRQVIASRRAAPGVDFVASFILFLLALYKLTRRLRPDLSLLSLVALAFLAATLLEDHFTISRFAAAASAPVVSDEMVNSLRWLAFFKWELLFLDTILCTAVLARTAQILRFGSKLLVFAAAAGAVVLSYNDRLVAPVALIMFVGMCGVSALLLLTPEVVYPMETTEKSAGGVSA